MRIPNLTLTRLLEQGPESLSSAAKCISNPFWKAVLARFPQLERTFYTKDQHKLVGERVVWDNSDFLHEGRPLSRKGNGSSLTHHFNILNSFISPNTHVLMSEEEASKLLKGKHIQGWRDMVSAASVFLEARNIPWFSLPEPDFGPTHMGWSRIVSENFKSKKFYNILMTRPPDQPRNPNEERWREQGLSTFGSDRFDKIYRNHSKLRCSLRVKYEELRVIWGRQELNRYKSRYADRGAGNSTKCSYCDQETENEIHLYIECNITDHFMFQAQNWYRQTFGVTPSLMLNGPRLFGLENEAPNDLHNIFYRSARYCIYSGRRKAPTPSMKVFKALIREELRQKFKGNGDIKNTKTPEDKSALHWLKVEMGWTLPAMNGNTLINLNPWRNRELDPH